MNHQYPYTPQERRFDLFAMVQLVFLYIFDLLRNGIYMEVWCRSTPSNKMKEYGIYDMSLTLITILEGKIPRMGVVRTDFYWQWMEGHLLLLLLLYKLS